jgi:hypothetical protein
MGGELIAGELWGDVGGIDESFRSGGWDEGGDGEEDGWDGWWEDRDNEPPVLPSGGHRGPVLFHPDDSARLAKMTIDGSVSELDQLFSRKQPLSRPASFPMMSPPVSDHSAAQARSSPREFDVQRSSVGGRREHAAALVARARKRAERQLATSVL